MTTKSAANSGQTPITRKTLTYSRYFSFPDESFTVASGCASIRGPRPVNEDAAAVLTLVLPNANHVHVILVGDGVGGYTGGQEAANLAVSGCSFGIAQQLERDAREGRPLELKLALVRGFEEANAFVVNYGRAHPDCAGLATTLTVGAVHRRYLTVGSIADSRLYLLREGEAMQLTKDDSFVQCLIDAGVINEEQARNHPRANVITHALGENEDLKSLVISQHELADGDIVLACSDGFWKQHFHLALDNFSSHSRYTNTSLEALARQLACQAVVRGSDDNTTVALLAISDDQLSLSKTNAY